MWTLFLILFAPLASWEPQSVHRTLDECTAALVEMEIEDGQGLICKYSPSDIKT